MFKTYIGSIPSVVLFFNFCKTLLINMKKLFIIPFLFLTLISYSQILSLRGYNNEMDNKLLNSCIEFKDSVPIIVNIYSQGELIYKFNICNISISKVLVNGKNEYLVEYWATYGNELYYVRNFSQSNIYSFYWTEIKKQEQKLAKD